MAVYVGLMVATVTLGFFAQLHNNKAKQRNSIGIFSDSLYNHRKNEYGLSYYLLIFVFWFVSSFRYYVGTDFGGYYKHIYSLSEVKHSFRNLDEPIVKLITYLSRQVIDDGLFVIIVLATLITIFVFIGISRYDTGDITLILLFYIFTGCLSFSFNGIRQALAISFIFAFSKKADKRWILKYALIIFIAYLIHKSSLVLLPILLLANLKVTKRNFFIILFSGVITPYFFDFAYTMMGIDLTNEEALLYIEREINPIRVIVAVVIVLIVLLIQNKEEFFESEGFIFNMSLYNAILVIATMNSAYLNRVTRFSSLFIPLFIPKVLKRMTPVVRFIVTGLSVILFLIYWIYEQHGNFAFMWSFGHFGEA